MHKAKYMLTGIAAASLFFAATSKSAAIDIDISGFLDMSVTSTKTDGSETEDHAGLDQANVKFSAALSDELSFQARVFGGSDEDFDLEQANFTYMVSDTVSITAGKFLSALGWEAYHAPNLYQYSTSATLVYPGMMNGASAKFANDAFEVQGAALASAWDSTDTDSGEMAFEGNIRLTAIENFTLFVGFATEEFAATDATEDAPAMGDYDQSLINVWASYQLMENVLIAAEFNDVSDWGGADNDGEGWLAMVNIGLTDAIGLTLRTSALDVESGSGAAVTDNEKWTVAPSYVATDALSFVAEFSSTDDNISGLTTEVFALEAIVVF